MINKKIFYTLIVVVATLFATLSSRVMNNFIQSDKDVRAIACEKFNLIQSLYNNGELLKIYNEGTEDFKKITSEDDFISLMERKKEVLGDFVKSQLLTSNVINSNVVILTFRSTYKNYSLIEEFHFIRKSKDDDLQLGTYFIDDGGKRGEVIRQ